MKITKNLLKKIITEVLSGEEYNISKLKSELEVYKKALAGGLRAYSKQDLMVAQRPLENAQNRHDRLMNKSQWLKELGPGEKYKYNDLGRMHKAVMEKVRSKAKITEEADIAPIIRLIDELIEDIGNIEHRQNYTF